VGVAKEILIVEDDRKLAAMCTRALEAEGYEVVEAHDGVAALEAVARIPPALIVLDVLLPKRDGRAVLAELQKSPSSANVPVIVVSGVFKGQTTARELQDAGAKGFLEKPFEPADLVAEVRSLIGPPERDAEAKDHGRAQLEDVSAAELLWRFMDRGASGAVYFQRGSLQKLLLLDLGRPVAIRSNSAAETLDRFLLEREQIDRAGFDALARARAKGDRNGRALVRLGLLSVEQVEAAIGAQAAAKVLEMFAWTAGEAWLNERIRQVSYASPLSRWTPESLLLRGVQHVPPRRVLGILSTFESFGAELGDRVLDPRDAKLPSVAALLHALRRPARVGDLVQVHAAALYGLWLMGAVNFGLAPASGDDASTPSRSVSPAVEAGRATELTESLERMRAQPYFQLLGVARDALPDVVEEAYAKLARRFGPERFASDPAAVQTVGAAIAALLATARDTLVDDTRREAYAAALLGGEASGTDDQSQVVRKLTQDGEALLAKREYAQALEKLEQACRLAPEDANAQVLYGWVHFVVHRAAGGERAATRSVERAIALDPESPKGYFYLAQIHKACARNPQAQRLLRKVLELDPKHVEAAQTLRVLNMRASKEKASQAAGGLFGLGKKK
jgi:CheY-like chemotaxis protein